MHIKRFNWSQKTYSILYKLGIIDTEDFEGVSLKALKEMGIPEKTIKQIEDICKVHNIETKETDLAIYHVEFTYRETHKTPLFDKLITNDVTLSAKYIASNPDSIKEDIIDYCNENNYTFKEFKIKEIELISNAHLLDAFDYVHSNII